MSDVLISLSLTNRLKITLGKGDNWLEFYDNTLGRFRQPERRWQLAPPLWMSTMAAIRTSTSPSRASRTSFPPLI